MATIFVPNELYCPITGELMVDPVSDPNGHTYERKAILKWLSKNNSIGIRIPDHDVPKKIINKCNFPIFCTSANISGKKSCRDIKDVVKNFKNEKITIIDGGKTKFRKESTIIDVTENKIKILRKGYLNKKNLINC